MLARLLFDESLAELADELLLLEDEDVSAADAEAPRRNARIARVDDAELLSVSSSQSTKSSTTSPSKQKTHQTRTQAFLHVHVPLTRLIAF